MAGEPSLQRITPDELPALLTRLKDEQTTELTLVGQGASLSALSEDWSAERQGPVVYQLSSRLSKLPQELLRLDQLTSLNLYYNSVGVEGARAIAEHLGQLTSLNLYYNSVGVEGARAIAEHLGQLTSLNLGLNQVGAE